MSNIDNMIAKIETMKPAERQKWLARVKARLASDPGDADARRLEAAITAVTKEQNGQEERVSTGRLAWEKHRHGVRQMLGYDGDKAVARIFKRANHSNDDKDVYTVEIQGRELQRAFSEVAEARQAGEVAYQG